MGGGFVAAHGEPRDGNIRPRLEMTKHRKQWRRALRWLLWLIVAIVLALALLPVWFPWTARPVLGLFDLHYDHYDRMGYAWFSLSDVRGEWKETQLTVRQVECVLPTTWLWRKMTGGLDDTPGLIVSNAVLTVTAKTNVQPSALTKTNSTFAILNRIDRIGRHLRRYLPAAKLTNSAVNIQSTHLAVPQAEWQNNQLRAQVRPSLAPEIFELSAKLQNASSMSLSVTSDAYDTALQGILTREQNAWNFDGELAWLTNRADLSAQFTTNGWWPDRASLDAPQLRIPAELARMKGYQDLKAMAQLNLVSNHFSLQATGFALPSQPSDGRRPPLEATLRAHGTPNVVILDAFHLQAPWVAAQLTNSIGIKRTGELLEQAAQLRIAVDLSKMSGVSLTGQISGSVSVELTDDRRPVAWFDVSGSDVSGWGINAQSIGIHGQFNWPVLTLNGAIIEFNDGSTLNADGTYDVASQSLRKANWRAEGAFLNRFLQGFSYRDFEASGNAHGPLTNLTHSGRIAVEDFQGGALKPLWADAAWEAEALRFSAVAAEVTAADSVLSIAGQLDLSATDQGFSGMLERAQLRRNDEILYALQQPCAIQFSGANTNPGASQWTLAVDHFDWRSARKEISVTADVAWPARGDLQLTITNAALRDFSDFVSTSITNASLAQLGLDANWSNGPVHLSLNTQASLVDEQGRTFTAKGKLEADEAVQIEVLTLGSEFTPPLLIAGTLPVQVVPSRGKGWLVIKSGEPISLEANLHAAKEQIVVDLGRTGELQLSQPQFRASASGTFDSPSATLMLNIANINWQPPTNTMPGPQLNQLNLDVAITPELIELRELTARLDDQPIEASGQWPLSSGFWKKLLSERELPDWHDASGRLEIEDVQIAALSRYLPQALAPEGQLNLNVSLAEGGKLRGLLTLTNASTRPLGKLAPLRDIDARVILDGTQATLEAFHGQMGGQPLVASGKAEFALDGPLNYQLHLRGSNVPVARSLELLLRGDLDVTLQGNRDSPATLTGEVRLRNGLYVRYASDLLWSGPKRPEVQPPYFSVTNAPFADWKLDLRIHGDRFMNVRIPVFSGVISADMKLQGTLRTPELNGDVRINSGRVMFPFGTLAVEEGYVSFSGNDPRGPALDIRASGRTLNYEVRLEVTGPANGANIEFTSTPPLNSEEILLLLTAGELPDKQYTFSTEARAGRLASFLGRDLFSRFSGSTGTEQRLTINTGESISEEGKLTYSVEYKLSERWSVIGEYDRFNAFNANLKWKILSR